jgi:quercetin dioxygenase-like cupin family protein/alkylhydroperoxidase/carboxymuconolactone decarboxylase family protein YurZ
MTMKTQLHVVLIAIFFVFFCMSSVSFAENTQDELSKKEKAIVPIAAFTASGNIDRLKTSLNQGLDDGLTVNEIKEIFVHLYAYAGFPRALNGINAFIAVMDDRKAQGKVDEVGREATPLPENYNPNAYGHKVRNNLVGRDISNRTSGYPVFTPIIDKFLVEHLFGDIFARDVLSHQERELVTISILSSLPGAEPQLKGHLGIAMRMGYSEAQLIDFIDVLRERVGAHVAENSAQVLGTVLGTPLPDTNEKAIQVTKKTTAVKASSDYFTGTATVSSRFKSEATDNYRGGIVDFEAGARTAWHKHPAGQTLVIISGRGLVQSEGETVQEVLPGDTVWIPEGERHWHGAAPDSGMSHVAISEPYNGATVTWMEHVSDEQYKK